MSSHPQAHEGAEMQAQAQAQATKVFTVKKGQTLHEVLGLPANTPVSSIKLAKPIVIKDGVWTVEVLV